MGCSAPRSSIHEVDAVLAGGRATATTNSCTGYRDKATRGKRSQFLELIGSVAVAVPADYTRYEPTVYLYGESGRNCQVRLGVPSLAGGQSVPSKSEMVTHRDVPSPVHPWEMRLYFRFLEIEMAKSNLSSMSVDALLKLRDDVGTALSRRADELKNQLSRLGGEIGPYKERPASLT